MARGETLMVPRAGGNHSQRQRWRHCSGCTGHQRGSGTWNIPLPAPVFRPATRFRQGRVGARKNTRCAKGDTVCQHFAPLRPERGLNWLPSTISKSHHLSASRPAAYRGATDGRSGNWPAGGQLWQTSHLETRQVISATARRGETVYSIAGASTMSRQNCSSGTNWRQKHPKAGDVIRFATKNKTPQPVPTRPISGLIYRYQARPASPFNTHKIPYRHGY